MDNLFIKLRQIFILLGDVIVLYFSLFLALTARYGIPIEPGLWADHFRPFTLIFALTILTFYINGLYDLSFAKNDVRFYRRFLEALAISALIAAGFFYLNPAIGIAPKTNLFLQLLFFTILFIAWRNLWNRFIGAGVWKNRIIFVGGLNGLKELYDALAAVPQFGFELHSAYLENQDSQNLSDLPSSIMPISDVSLIPKIIKQRNISAVVLGTKPEKSENLAGALYQSIYLQVSFIDLAEFLETMTGRIPTARLTEAWFLENLKESKKKIYGPVKTASDYLLAAVFLLLLAVSVPLVALANLAGGRGPLFYKQKRIGKNGKEFWIYKFRTMVADAEKNGAVFAQKSDPRVTKFGKFMRRSRLDELPQIWNILRGEMSFIGPRPERPEFVAELQRAMPFYGLRHLVKPGLTGWAQINYPYAGSLEENLKKLQYDLYYVKNRSLILDMAILLKTINIVLRWMGR